MLLSVAVWSGFALTAWATGQALGIDLSPASVIMLTAVINLGIAIPSSPGFVGTYQWLAIATLEPFGFARTTAFAYSVLLHAVTLLPATLVGYVILAIAWRKGRLRDGQAGERQDLRDHPEARRGTTRTRTDAIDDASGS